MDMFEAFAGFHTHDGASPPAATPAFGSAA